MTPSPRLHRPLPQFEALRERPGFNVACKHRDLNAFHFHDPLEIGVEKIKMRRFPIEYFHIFRVRGEGPHRMMWLVQLRSTKDEAISSNTDDAAVLRCSAEFAGLG
jgi:hypothetical protein